MNRLLLVVLLSIVCISQVLCQTPDNKQEKNSITLGHIAVSVKNLDKAIEWYQNVMGFQLTKEPVEIDTDTSPLGGIARKLFGSNMKKLRIAQMTMKNQVGLELFEFILPETEVPKKDEFNKAGFLHICVIVEDIDALIRKLEENGGKVKIEHVSPTSQQKVVFCEDPDGNIIEVSTYNWVQKSSKPSK